MAGLIGTRFLDSARIQRIITTRAADIERLRPLVYLDRVPQVNAFDDEIIGRFTGSIYAADIIADDQEAVVYDSGKVEFVTNSIPNLKLGKRLGQATLNRLSRMESGLNSVSEENALLTWEQTIVEQLLEGVRQRMNALICAMMIDSLNYNRLGLQLTGATWGMPSNLKVTVATPWQANPTTATPIDDIFTMDQVATDNYGGTFDKITMGSKAFRAMVKTTEFANKSAIPMMAGFAVGAANISTKDLKTTTDMIGQILNKEIVIDDATYQERSSVGTKSITRVLPNNKILLSRKEDEGDGRIMDWANGVVTESMVGAMIGDGPTGMTNDAYGPLAYYTSATPDLNPPGVVAWGVARGFPRKYVPESTAVLDIGTVT